MKQDKRERKKEREKERERKSVKEIERERREKVDRRILWKLIQEKREANGDLIQFNTRNFSVFHIALHF